MACSHLYHQLTWMVLWKKTVELPIKTGIVHGLSIYLPHNMLCMEYSSLSPYHWIASSCFAVGSSP